MDDYSIIWLFDFKAVLLIGIIVEAKIQFSLRIRNRMQYQLSSFAAPLELASCISENKGTEGCDRKRRYSI